MRLATLALFLLAAAPGGRAQTAPTPGSCTLGRATAVLDASEVSARLFNTGSLFFGNTYQAAYLVPRREGKSPIYATGLWLGGKVGGELRVAGGTYGPSPGVDYTFWPGPLGADARPVDPGDCGPYDRIYTVSRDDVAAYYRTGVATDDLRDWPHALGAPVLDGDGDPANYNLAGGDQPAITGAQTAWWLMNDVGNVHPAQNTPPLGVEVRVEASAFPFGVLGETTTYRYTLTNRTAATIDSVYIGMFADPDLGDATDDRVGTDTTGSMAFVYNGDNDDGTGYSNGYGLNPPAIGYQVVSGPVGLPNGRDDDGDGQVDEAGERLMLTGSSYFTSGGPAGTTDPDTGIEIYNYLRGRWGDGSTKRTYGNGFQQTQGAVTPFMFPGDPVTGQAWSEVNPGAGLPPVAPSDRRMMMSTGPFRFAPGASESIVFAIPYARGASNLDSVTRLRGVAGGLIEAFRAGQLAPTRVERPILTVDGAVRLSLPAPNPFRERTTVRYQIPTGTDMRATLLDARGRRIAVLFDGPTQAPEGVLAIDGTGLAAGVYRVQIVVPGGEKFLTLVRTR